MIIIVVLGELFFSCLSLLFLSLFVVLIVEVMFQVLDCLS